MLHKSSFGNTGSPYQMFFASLLLHLIAIAAIITVPGTSKQLTFGAPYSVALVGPEVLQPPRGTSMPKDLFQPPAPEPPVILKRKTESPPDVGLIKKKDPVKETVKDIITDKSKDIRQADLQKKIDAIRRQEHSKAAVQKKIDALRRKELAKTGAGETPGVPYGSASGRIGAASSSANSSKIDEYSRFVWAKIKKNWTLPPTMMPKDNVETIVEVRIARSGTLEYIDFEKRSGNSYFDESAMRAVKKSAPFPPLAGWVNDTFIDFGIRFHSEDFR
ncbi:MAG: TonB family protein [Smithellaceae bacterium]|nr:TonB family protein [Smithellaceae bacterium]